MLALVALLASGCAHGLPGDPAPPIAFSVNASHALSAVKVLLCPRERVMSIVLSRDVGTDAAKAGPILWWIDATGASTAATFEPGKLVEGFRTVVAASLPITGSIVADLRTTSATFEDVTDTSLAPAGSTLLSGQTLDSKLEQLVIKDRC